MDKLKKKVLILLASTFCLMGVVFTFFFLNRSSTHGRVVIGAKNCTEQHILSEILAQLIESRTQLKVERRFSLEGTTICFYALKSGSIDLYCEYTGTAWLDILKKTFERGQQHMYAQIKEIFKERYGLVWLDPIGFNNTYVLVMRQSDADRQKIATISDLAQKMQAAPFKLATDPEFASRPELQLMQTIYPFGMPLHPQIMDQALLYLTLSKKSIDVITGFSTDSALFGTELVVLKDDLTCFPPYHVAPVVREEVLSLYPELEGIINELSGRITEQKMQELNFKVERKNQSVENVARDFLEL